MLQFERGPRNCIGQELANIEGYVILAMILRRYDFVKVGLGETALDEKGQPILDSETGQYKVTSELYPVSIPLSFVLHRKLFSTRARHHRQVADRWDAPDATSHLEACRWDENESAIAREVRYGGQ